MKTRLILRHAKSSWKHPELSDHDRPLNKRGERDAPRMGRLLYQEDLLPGLILSSTAKRARATAESVVIACAYTGEIKFNRDLYSFGAQAYLEALVDLPDEYQHVMVVGHNPGMEELLETLTGEYERMPTAALAQVALPIHKWEELNEETLGELVRLWRPKEL